MYRHFAVVTVLLTLGVAMFAEGENREAAAAQVEPRETVRRDETEIAGPPIARPAERRQKLHRAGGFDGFDRSFGAPMDNPLVSLTAQAATVASAVTQTGYSDKYLASLGAEERALLIAELDKEGVGSPEERERKAAALIASSEARSGRTIGNY